MAEGSRAALTFEMIPPDPMQGTTPGVLPVSPCLREIHTGLMHPWDEAMAQRSDLFVNCDEKGNTDPAAWQGRRLGGGDPRVPRTPPMQAQTPLDDFGAYRSQDPSQILTAPKLGIEVTELQGYQASPVVQPGQPAPAYTPMSLPITDK